eukprot:2602656-Rhodomonas_salina.1
MARGRRARMAEVGGLGQALAAEKADREHDVSSLERELGEEQARNSSLQLNADLLKARALTAESNVLRAAEPGLRRRLDDIEMQRSQSMHQVTHCDILPSFPAPGFRSLTSLSLRLTDPCATG